jgi:F-type H+-transporting ATPase subunit beta
MASKQIGKVVQCIGAVVDVEFPRDQMPKVFDALIIGVLKNNPSRNII